MRDNLTKRERRAQLLRERAKRQAAEDAQALLKHNMPMRPITFGVRKALRLWNWQR